MKKKMIVLSAVAVALVLSVGCVSAFAAENDSDAADASSEAEEETAEETPAEATADAS